MIVKMIKDADLCNKLYEDLLEEEDGDAIDAFIEKYVVHGEYISIEIISLDGTARLIPTKEWR